MIIFFALSCVYAYPIPQEAQKIGQCADTEILAISLAALKDDLMNKGQPYMFYWKCNSWD